MGEPSASRDAAAVAAAVPPKVRRIVRTLKAAGFRSWAVGGCVRDVLLSQRAQPRSPGDWDLATDAKPQEVIALFRKVIPTGIAHGTVTVVVQGEHFELTTLRGETSYTDGRRPDQVIFIEDLKEDLARRDFTVNAIAFDISEERLVDPFDGRGDLDRRLLRAVGDPLERFAEDGLRVMRCARFAATLEMDVDAATRSAMRPSLGSFAKVAKERIRDEWFKALASQAPSRCLRLMRDEGLLSHVAPGLFAPIEEAQGGERPSDPRGPSPDDHAFARACELVDRARPDPERRLALLLTRGFPGDESVRAATSLAQALKCSSKQRDRLVRLCAHGRLPLTHGEEDKHTARQLLQALGRDHYDDFVIFQEELAWGDPSLERKLTGFRTWADDELRSPLPLHPRELRVSGGDLIAELGVPKGPLVGRLLSELFELATRDPAKNDRTTLLEEARRRLPRGLD